MKHTIENKDLHTTLIVDEGKGQDVLIGVIENDKVFDDRRCHYMTLDDLENLIHVLNYVYKKKKELNPNYGRRVSALSLKSIEVLKSR